jgi:hypothetical protein
MLPFWSKCYTSNFYLYSISCLWIFHHRQHVY